MGLTTVLVALTAAGGLLLIYSGTTGGSGPRDRRARNARSARVAAVTAEVRPVAPWIIGIGVSAAGLTWAYTGIETLAVAIGAACSTLPVSMARSRRSARLREQQQAWPDAVAGMMASVRAGASLGEACCGLAERGPDALRAAFSAFAATYRSSAAFSEALDALREVAADPTGDRIAAALRIAHDVGGTDLVRVLRTTADFARDDLMVRREIEARWSWTVAAARLSAAAPWIVLALMMTRPEAARAFATPAGSVVIVIGAAATVVGYRLMCRAGRLPAEARLTR